MKRIKMDYKVKDYFDENYVKAHYLDENGKEQWKAIPRILKNALIRKFFTTPTESELDEWIFTYTEPNHKPLPEEPCMLRLGPRNRWIYVPTQDITSEDNDSLVVVFISGGDYAYLTFTEQFKGTAVDDIILMPQKYIQLFLDKNPEYQDDFTLKRKQLKTTKEAFLQIRNFYGDYDYMKSSDVLISGNNV
jgi:hypothetical protein